MVHLFLYLLVMAELSLQKNLKKCQNIKKLQEHGYVFVEPEVGYLACGAIGKGKYPKITEIVKVLKKEMRI